jgi:hypothetical protein
MNHSAACQSIKSEHYLRHRIGVNRFLACYFIYFLLVSMPTVPRLRIRRDRISCSTKEWHAILHSGVDWERTVYLLGFCVESIPWEGIAIV